MRAFQYSFQKVLDLKTNTKRQSEWVLAQSIGQLQTAEQSLDSLMKERHNISLQFQKMADRCASVIELQWCQQYLDHLDELITSAIASVRTAERKVQQQQKEVELKMIDEKVWTKAREKAEVAYKQELAAAEQVEMDELATVRYHMATR
ncbi:flagellar export protein FliJ [Paenibacillus marinisediminis]